MSYYYSYYIGYKLDGKIYPWGPYDADGNLKPVICRSRSFASDLHYYFLDIDKDSISEELTNEFKYNDCLGETRILNVKYLPENDLPSGSYIKHGYFLIDEVKQYNKGEDPLDCFSEVITPEVYAAKLQHEMTFGKNKPTKDRFGCEYTEPNASDYMYFAYPDYCTEEYESFVLRHMIDAMSNSELSKKAEYVILETEG